MIKVKDIGNALAKSDAKGVEKVVLIVNATITKVQIVLTTVFEGKPITAGKKHKNPLDNGIVPTFRDLSQIDLCNIFDYTVSKIPNEIKKIRDKKDGSSKLADGTKKEAREKTPFEKALYYIQDKAYKGQILIDEYYLNYAESSDITAQTALLALCKNLQITIKTTDVSEIIANEELTKAFPQLQSYNNFINDVLGYFEKIGNQTLLDSKTTQKVKSYIDTTRGVLIAIQSLDPNRITGLLLSSLPQKVKDDLNKLNKIVKPEKLLPFLKTVQRRCIDIQTTASLLLTTIRKAQSIVSLAIGLIKLISTVKKFILGLLSAIPNLFTTMGSNVGAGIADGKLQKFIDNTLKRLGQLNTILYRSVNVVEYIVAQIEQVIVYLRIIIANLESCENGDPEIVKDLKNSLESLQNVNQALKDFKTNYDNKKSSTDSTFGDNKNKYTIKIITEQLTDEGISLKRRYGIALDRSGALVASSTPTFASQDSIIIEEVKLILVSQKLVNPEISSLSPEGISIINEASNFLEDDELSQVALEDLTFNEYEQDVDGPDNENESIGIGLNAFVNKLPGGKKLRNRVKTKLDQKKEQYGPTVSSVKVPTPNVGGGTSEKQDSDYDKNRKVSELQERRAELVKQRERALKTGPAGIAIVAAKTKQIRDIDKQIAELKK